ncbi:MAG: hypothetical protein ACREKM_00305, partial [Longimicrobiales bacterium]
MRVSARVSAVVVFAALTSACSSAMSQSGATAGTDHDRIAAIHDRFVFADIHAHPSRFHRANVEQVGADE